MADERKYYVLCADNCKFESMTKEQILAAISQAVSTGEIKDVDTGFVTKIKEQNSGAALSFWVGTSAEYNALPEKAGNCFYILTDDTAKEDIENLLKVLNEATTALQTTVGEHTKMLKEHSDSISHTDKLLTNGVGCYTDTFRIWDNKNSSVLGELKARIYTEFLHLHGEITFDTSKYTTGVENYFGIQMSTEWFDYVTTSKLCFTVPVLLIGEGFSENSGNSYGSAQIFIDGSNLTLIIPDTMGIDKVKFYINVMFPIKIRND